MSIKDLNNNSYHSFFIMTAFAANTGIAITKTAGAVVTGSGTLFAEALHSFADCTNQILLLIGMSQANRKPDYLF